MAAEKIHIDQFLEMATHYPVLDVRSPGEFTHAHIPGAYNLALFSDEERKVVGTTYKQSSREAAIKIGLDYFGPRMRKMVEEVEQLAGNWNSLTALQNQSPPGNTKKVLVHCWRGGMRSAAVAWLLDLYGFKVYTLVGGYKKFREYVLDSFTHPYQFNIVGGYTGSGKTEVLNELQQQQEQVVDLEGLAGHKGSAFGNLEMIKQPSQEMFENRLAVALRKKQVGKTIWLEDESQRIGEVNIPPAMWRTMRSAAIFFLRIPFEQRLAHIIAGYGKGDKEKMINAIIRIKKRLGGLETKTAVNFLMEDNIPDCFRILLKYYDKWYYKSLQLRPELEEVLTTIDASTVDQAINAESLVLHSHNPILKQHS